MPAQKQTEQQSAPRTVAEVLGGKSRAPRAATYKVSKDSPRVQIPTDGEVPVFVARGTRVNGQSDDEYLIVIDGTRQTGVKLDAVCYGIAGGVLDGDLVKSLLAVGA